MTQAAVLPQTDHLEDMKLRRGGLVAEARKLEELVRAQGRAFNEIEEKQFIAIFAEIDGLDVGIAREEKLRSAEQASGESFRAAVKPGAGDDRARPNITFPRPDGFPSLGEFLQATVRASRPGGTVDTRLLEQRAALGLNETVGGDGGFLLQANFTSELVTRAYELGVLASRVRRMPLGANSNGLKMPAIDETSRANGSRWGGVQSYWAAEASTVTASKPKFRQISLELEKLFALVYATDELVQDATALESYVRLAASEELAFRLDDAILNGTGSGQPLGILNSGGLVTISKEVGQPAATFQAENVSKMWARCFAASRRNAVWLYNQDMEPQLDQLALPIGTAGVPVYLPAGAGLREASDPMLKGRPMLAIEQAATLGTVGDIALVNLQEYVMIERPMQSAMSIHVQFTTDEVVFRFILRVDGEPVWHSALTPKNGTNTLSAFVALETRS